MPDRTPTFTQIRNQFTSRPAPTRGQSRTARKYRHSGAARTLSAHEKQATDISNAISSLNQLQGYTNQRHGVVIVKWLLDGNIRVPPDHDIPEKDAATGSFLVCKCKEVELEERNQWMHTWHLKFNRAAHEIIRSSEVKMKTLRKILKVRIDERWIKDQADRDYAQALIDHFLQPWEYSEWLLEKP